LTKPSVIRRAFADSINIRVLLFFEPEIYCKFLYSHEMQNGSRGSYLDVEFLTKAYIYRLEAWRLQNEIGFAPMGF